MANLLDTAKSYDPTSKTKNIADLDKVSARDMEVVDDSFEFEKNGETKTVNQKVMLKDGEKYRIPVTVIQQVKILAEDNPNFDKFKVRKSGTTKDDTRYQVIPLAD